MINATHSIARHSVNKPYIIYEDIPEDMDQYTKSVLLRERERVIEQNNKYVNFRPDLCTIVYNSSIHVYFVEELYSSILLFMSKIISRDRFRTITLLDTDNKSMIIPINLILKMVFSAEKSIYYNSETQAGFLFDKNELIRMIEQKNINVDLLSPIPYPLAEVNEVSRRELQEIVSGSVADDGVVYDYIGFEFVDDLFLQRNQFIDKYMLIKRIQNNNAFLTTRNIRILVVYYNLINLGRLFLSQEELSRELVSTIRSVQNHSFGVKIDMTIAINKSDPIIQIQLCEDRVCLEFDMPIIHYLILTNKYFLILLLLPIYRRQKPESLEFQLLNLYDKNRRKAISDIVQNVGIENTTESIRKYLIDLGFAPDVCDSIGNIKSDKESFILKIAEKNIPLSRKLAAENIEKEKLKKRQKEIEEQNEKSERELKKVMDEQGISREEAEHYMAEKLSEQDGWNSSSTDSWE